MKVAVAAIVITIIRVTTTIRIIKARGIEVIDSVFLAFVIIIVVFIESYIRVVNNRVTPISHSIIATLNLVIIYHFDQREMFQRAVIIGFHFSFL